MIITDAYGTQVTSQAAALTVTEKNITTTGPEDQVAENGTAVFTVNVEGEGLTYRWQYKRPDSSKWFYTTMQGYATDTLTVTATKARNGYLYRCIITDAYGNSVTTDAAEMTVATTKLRITSHPENHSVSSGYVFFYVEAEGENLRYQWQIRTRYFDWMDLSDNAMVYGSTTSYLSLEGATADDVHAQTCVRCVITDGNGNSVTSNVAYLVA